MSSLPRAREEVGEESLNLADASSPLPRRRAALLLLSAEFAYETEEREENAAAASAAFCAASEAASAARVAAAAASAASSAAKARAARAAGAIDVEKKRSAARAEVYGTTLRILEGRRGAAVREGGGFSRAQQTVRGSRRQARGQCPLESLL